ncbi:MAG: thiosulfate/3-mercaptopyruvate sulfurtransferase [Oceanicoccus sp.]|jgi:thiosulfate/3-mercaptopyruvate sulfurtransferase
MISIDLPLLLEAEQLAEYLTQGEIDDNFLILDVCTSENYAKHHIPTAVHIAPQALQAGTPPVPGKLPSTAQLESLFSRVGLSANKHVIVYDDEGGGWAGRLIWTLDVMGHKNYSYLNGGLHAWLNEDHPCETKENKGNITDYRVTLNAKPIAEIDDILSKLGSSDFAVWDARSAEEFDGRKILAERAGHIPGAIHFDWLDLMDRERNMRLVDLEELQRKLDEMGLSKTKEIVTHCQTHHRSGLTYLTMKILGYPNIKGYDGSWSEWGNREDTPIEQGAT